MFNTEQRLPRLVIDLLARSNGVIIKVGDASHPNEVEVVSCYPDWAERNERLPQNLREFLRLNLCEKNDSTKPDYVA